jgi:predicted metal-dependent enzyme (double-stranded beta helix superfamily)
VAPPTTALQALVAAVDAALDNPALTDDAARVDAFRPAMAVLLADPDPLPAWAFEPWQGQAVGNLVHADIRGRYHILAVVFPEGTSSGVHFHGCWGLIGYLRGGDEETRYAATERPAGDVELSERSRHVWHQGDVTALLPPGDGWHRVRNPGPGPGVSVHVLCMGPADHPHRFWRRDDGRVFPYPFQEVAPDRWVARVVFDAESGLGGDY